MSTNSHELTDYNHPSLDIIGVFVPLQAVSVKLTGGELSVSTNPKAPLDILRVTEKGKRKVINPAAEIVLDFFKRAPEHSESLQTPDREGLTQAIQAGLVVERIFDNFHSSVGVTQRIDSDELRSYRGKRLTPRASHDLVQRGRYLRVTGERIREAQERIKVQLARAEYWLSRLPNPPRVDQLPKAVRAAGGIAAAAATVVTPLAAQADAKTAAASHVSIATEINEPHYAFQSQGMSETRVNTADLAYLMSLPPIPEEKTPSHVDQEGSEFIATPQTPSEPTPTATVQKKSSVDYQIRSLANTNSESYGTISQVIGNQPFEVDAKYHDGTHKWYRVTLSSETSENRSGWIREDGLNILPNEAGQIPDLPDLTMSYNLAASMPVFDSDEKAINVLTSLETLDTLMKALNGSTFPPETLDSLAVFSSQKDQSGTYTDVYIQTRDLEGTRPDGTRYTNEAGSLIMISSPYGDTQPRFLPPNIVLDHLRSQGKDYTTISYSNGGNIIRVINPETTATIANLDVQTYLRTGSLEQSMIVFETEQITLPPVLGVFLANNFSDAPEYRYLNPDTNTYERYDVKRILDKVNPTEIINNPLTINGEVVKSGRVEINDEEYLMVVGTIIEQTSIPNGNYHSIITTLAVPRPLSEPDGATAFDLLHIDDPNRMPDLHKRKFVLDDPASLLLVNPEETIDGGLLGTRVAITEHEDGQIIQLYNSRNGHVVLLIEINNKTQYFIDHLEHGVPLGEDSGRFADWVNKRLPPEINAIVLITEEPPLFYTTLVDPYSLNK